MKKQIISIALTLMTVASIQTASASLGRLGDGTSVAGAVLGTTAASPLLAIGCLKGELKNEVGECHLAATSVATTSTLFLLKEVEAVQPDALDYVAGAAPSPALEAVVEMLQDFAIENLDMEMTFDEAVNDIITNI